MPPEGTDTLAKLSSSPAPTRKLSVIEYGGERYFVWIGLRKQIFLASGPPVYVFDSSGKRVGLSGDIGDCPDKRMRDLFFLGHQGRAITFGEALTMIKSP